MFVIPEGVKKYISERLCWTSLLNPLKPSGQYTYHLLQHTKTLHSAHTAYLCVPYGSHNK
jgi:hypothetical protein